MKNKVRLERERKLLHFLLNGREGIKQSNLGKALGNTYILGPFDFTVTETRPPIVCLLFGSESHIHVMF